MPNKALFDPSDAIRRNFPSTRVRQQGINHAQSLIIRRLSDEQPKAFILFWSNLEPTYLQWENLGQKYEGSGMALAVSSCVLPDANLSVRAWHH